MSKAPPETAFESSDVPPSLLVSLAGGLAASIAAVLIALSIAFPIALRSTPRGPAQPLPPDPRLQTAPGVDLARYRSAEQAKLGSYRLMPNGHVQVPIDVAMRSEAARGWSKRQ